MSRTFEGKRLLLMGGAFCLDELIDFQKETGVEYIVTTDTGHMDSPLRRIAQELYEVSPIDSEGIIRLVREKNIDGIFCSTNETIIPSAIEVAEACRLPYYATKEQWAITSNKKRFKEMCRQYGLPVVKEYSLTEHSLTNIEYPVVLKPVDACGSRGVVLCNDEHELRQLYPTAKKESRKGEVIAEQYINSIEVVVYYTLCDGQVSLSSVCDRHNRLGSNSINPIPDAFQYPSKYTGLVLEKYNDDIIRMIKHGLKLKNGVLGIQGFAVGEELAFFEMGYRLGGTSQFRYTYALNGIKNIDMLLNYALCGSMDYYPQSYDNPKFRKPCCTLTLLSKGGVVDRITGVEEISAMEGVLCVEVHCKPGDKIIETNTLAQIAFWVFLLGNDVTDLKRLIRKVQEKLKAYDSNGNNMIISSFDPERLDYGNMLNC